MPNEYIDHLRSFLIPLSLETLNKSKSPLPTNAPLKLFESGAKSKEIKIIRKETIINIAVNITLVVFILILSLTYLYHYKVKILIFVVSIHIHLVDLL